YHYWRHRDSALRQQDLHGWIAPMLPIRAGLAIVLRLLRASGRSEQKTAQRGAFQLMMGGRSAQLIRLKTGQGEPCLPEISAGKFAINIRFLRPDMDQRPRQIDSTVNFELTLCNL
ncbi:MAG: cell division protein ZapD, partial [Sulfuritalea sp.]|nr:cell division protein ZapD [Sulfuritalea sp.]